MNKGLLITLGVVAVVLLYCVGTYNSLVKSDEGVTAEWQNVETQYQRRADLIPNLVETIKSYTNYEGSTLKEVIEARANATSVKIDPSNMTAEQLAEYQKAQSEVNGALGRLLAVAEAYPELKANEQYNTLMAQLEGTENRIAVARKNYNDVAKSFNASIRTFPTSLIANLFGFQKHEYFQADEGSEKAPSVGNIFNK